ncbi:MAG: cytochrome c oxidase assembly protein [Corynebacterium sp.]|uniref:cytochrome c oxidase assembly protein n=1 Tax=unclassified Corynebacterium TaxID=2624378 RepID=UPI000964FFD8|nr:cytochrome c oxidase assembly protein [Corynebacterium sp. CNJ-954]OLT53704.1 hypothetical protein BJF89_02490 [Corynebacterium sp. CNJ-954]
MTRKAVAPLSAFLIAAAAMVLLALWAGETPYLQSTEPFPGTVTSTVSVVAGGLSWFSGSLTLGGIALVAVLSTPDRRGWLSVETYLVQRAATGAALMWAVLSWLMVATSVAVTSGIPLSRVVEVRNLTALMSAAELPYAWLATAVAATVSWLILAFSSRWTPTTLTALPVAVGILAVPLTGDVGQGPEHDTLTTLGVVVFLLIPMVVGMKTMSIFIVDGAKIPTHRASLVTLIAEGVALVFGILMVLTLAPGDFLTNTVYGWACLATGVVLLAFAATDTAVVYRHRRNKSSIGRLPVVPGLPLSIVGAIVLVTVRAAVDLYTAPSLLAHDFTIWDVYLGYELPGPPDTLRLLTQWRFDFLLGTAAIVMAALYVWGFVRLRRAGVDWPVHKLFFWLAGCVLMLFGTSSGLVAYSTPMFSVHMGNHMLLNMYVPVMLVLATPIGLALRAIPASTRGTAPGPREWIVSLTHSRYARLITHPAFTFIMFVSSLYVVYFTPLYGMFAKFHWWHMAVTIHFLITGYLFFWTIIGTDPGPKPLPYLARLGLLMGAMPFHAFFGIALMATKELVAGDFYNRLIFDWLPSRLDDQWLGGALAWGLSEIPILIVAVAVGVQWFRHDQKVGHRIDRREDSGQTHDVDAYNDMLRELSERDARPTAPGSRESP